MENHLRMRPRVDHGLVAGLLGLSVPPVRNAASEPGNLDSIGDSVLGAVNAAKITRDSKSNLALAFIALGRERRNDITVFYAFCRLVDDIADSPETSIEEKAGALKEWRQWIRESAPDEPALARDVRGLYAKYSITPPMLEEIIDGVEMDLGKVRYRLSKNCGSIAIAWPVPLGSSVSKFSDIEIPPVATMRSSWGLLYR